MTIDGRPFDLTKQEHTEGWTWYSFSLDFESQREGSFFEKRFLKFSASQNQESAFFFPTQGDKFYGPQPRVSDMCGVWKRWCIFYLLYPQIFLFCLLLVNSGANEFLTFPQAIIVSATPVLAGILGQRFFKKFSGENILRSLVAKQIQYPFLVVASLVVIFSGMVYYYDDYRCRYISYRYGNALDRLIGQANRKVDPEQEFSDLYQIAPERKENLTVFQHLLWRARYDDAFARIVSSEPIGFKRSDVANRLIDILAPKFVQKLSAGDDVACGCVDPAYADDPRLVWFHAKVESLSDLSESNSADFEALRDYARERAEERANPQRGDWEAIARLYRLVLASFKPQAVNQEYEMAMQDLEELFDDSATRVRHSILELAFDLFAASNFIGYCEIDRGLDGYRRILRFRDFNNSSDTLREFPPEKLSVYRIVSLLQGDVDFFTNRIDETLQQECGPEGEKLKELFEREIMISWQGSSVLERGTWRNNSPAAPKFFEKSVLSESKGWR